MFLFANLLLLALLAGGVCSLLPVLRRRITLQDWWGQEFFLFSSRFSAQRQKIGRCSFFLGLAIYEFIVTFCYSNAYLTWPSLNPVLSDILYAVIALCFSVKILLGTKYRAERCISLPAGCFLTVRTSGGSGFVQRFWQQRMWTSVTV